MQNLAQQVRNAGVVGAGGAGFPTYKKIEGRVEIVIANGAECEPLLYKDQALMENYPAEIIAGLQVIMDYMGASKGIVAIKSKNRKAIQTMSAHLPHSMSLFEMEDVYPAGDEYEVVYHSTGRRIPAGGLPIDIGVLVQNVETLYNVHRAVQGQPVIYSAMTINGNVRAPITGWFPLGMSYADVLEAAGGASIDDFVLIDGGPMMGKVVSDLSTPVTRTSSGFIVMPHDARLAVRKSQPERAYRRFGKSACDQCSLCTEMCPRYLLGYPIQPHLVMRSLLTSGEMSETLTFWAQACCECNICTLWACPEDLDPRNVCVTTKRDLKKNDMWLPADKLQSLTREVHPMKEYRGVPTKRLTARLGLAKFPQEVPFRARPFAAKTVTVPLQQHIGAAPNPIVRAGEVVRAGQRIAEAVEGTLSVPAHASIDGIVRAVGDVIVIDTETPN